jgi:hypothetical protein
MRLLPLFLALISFVSGVQAQTAEEKRAKSVRQGIEYLLQRGQAADGTFSSQAGTAITGLVVAAILENEGGAVADPRIQKSLKILEANVRSDGGIYALDSRHKNYRTPAFSSKRCISWDAMAKTKRSKKPWYLCRELKTWNPLTIPLPLPIKLTTADSITRLPLGAKVSQVKPRKEGSAVMGR